ncbi:MAG TPA: SRPBCC domain-containing protein [Rectinemataceae bacterium]|nr:SRPBCC domain-containing protein [Rectinemataceae bacterium]
MPRTMTQRVHFDAPPSTVFALYMDSRLHAETTGAGAAIDPRPGRAFTAWDGYIGGVTLHVEPDRMVVQTWRGSDWNRDDPDSIFVLLFLADGEGTSLHVTHANIPDGQFEGVRDGWKQYYWQPWKRWIKKQPH